MKNWRRYSKVIVAGIGGLLLFLNTSAPAGLLTPKEQLIIGAVLALGTTFGVFQVTNAR